MGKKTNATTGSLKRIKDSTIRKLLNVSSRLNPRYRGNMLFGFVELDGSIGEWGIVFDEDLGVWSCGATELKDPNMLAYVTIREYYENYGVIIE